MRLFLLKKRETIGGYDYDEAQGMVIRAEDWRHARRLAAKEAEKEGGHTWMDAKLSSCKRLNMDGPSGVLLRDVLSG